MNRIPRNFNRITAKMLIDTSESKPGDIIRIYKNLDGYLGYNPRTNRHFYIFASMIRNSEIVEIQNIERN